MDPADHLLIHGMSIGRSYASVLRISMLNSILLLTRNLRSLQTASSFSLSPSPSGCFLAAVQLYCDKLDMFVGSRIRGMYRERIVGQVYDSPVYGGPARFGLPRMVDGMTEPISNPALKKVFSARVSWFRVTVISTLVVLSYVISILWTY